MRTQFYSEREERWIWPSPNSETHECQHVTIGACERCRAPMDPRSWMTSFRTSSDPRDAIYNKKHLRWVDKR